MKNEGESRDEFRIRIHHIGGIGGYGPVEALSRLVDVEWIVYDAQKDSLSSTDAPNASFRLVNRAIGGANIGGVKLYVTEAASASGLFPPSPDAANYSLKYPDGHVLVWGDHARVKETVEIELQTVDSLVEDGVVPPVDFLSIDAQGAELQILEGAFKLLNTSALGVFCEVEFSELYKGQPLFCDIQVYLKERDFRLCEIDSLNYYNTEPLPWELLGKGFLTVGEAIFLKESRALATVYQPERGKGPYPLHIVQRLKLAAVAVAFDQLDYGITICRELEREHGISLAMLAKDTGVRYIQLLSELYATVCTIATSSGIGSLKIVATNLTPNNHSSILTMAKIAFGFFVVVAQSAVRRVAGRISKRKSDLFYPPRSKVFSKYGFDELAIKYAFRSKRIYYLTSNRGVRFLDFAAQVIAGLS